MPPAETPAETPGGQILDPTRSRIPGAKRPRQALITGARFILLIGASFRGMSPGQLAQRLEGDSRWARRVCEALRTAGIVELAEPEGSPYNPKGRLYRITSSHRKALLDGLK